MTQSNHAYVFIRKNAKNLKVELYGNLSVLCRNEDIFIDGSPVKLSRFQVNKLLEKNNGKYEDKKYYLEKKLITRSKRKS